MEFLDEYESRPRFLFQSKQSPLPSASDGADIASSFSFSSLHRRALFVSIPVSILIFALVFTHLNNVEPLKSFLLWIAFSLLIGPFAPPSITAGDIRVGIGPPLEEAPKISVESNEKTVRKSTKPPIPKKPFEDSTKLDGILEKSTTIVVHGIDRSNVSMNEERCQEGEWSEADDELLKKLMGKHPVGKPGRWEAIAEGFKGKHDLETVIMKAKEKGERKVGDQDSYKQFLKNRKPVDRRLVDESGDEVNTGNGIVNPSVEDGRKYSGWTAGEDLALLNALKTFPKEVGMRWEKIAAAVPGKTKAACMKRVGELAKDFRASKASSVQAS